MTALGLAAPNRIRCQRTAVARPYGGSLRLRGLVVDTKLCLTCGSAYQRGRTRRAAWAARLYCSTLCSNQRLGLGFWTHVSKTGSCWLWSGYINRNGYGVASHLGRTMGAHRVAWILRYGSIDPALTIDHLCRVHACVNPDHMEQVTKRVNTMRGISPMAIHARQTHCKSGHPFDEANTYVRLGWRTCRACNRINVKRYRERRKAVVR
jgi:hypothetical protein